MSTLLLSLFCRSMQRRRAPAAPEPEPEPTAAAEEATKPRAWHESIFVRVVLILIAFFVMLHLFLWKVVYDIAMSQNHERLRGTVREAVDSLNRVWEHL